VQRFGFLVRRAAQAVPLLVVVLFVVFVLVRLVPGDPGRALLGLRATPAAVAEIDHQLGLDQALLPGFVDYVGRIAHGDLGRSVRGDQSVTSLIGERLPVTLWLLVGATLLSLLFSVPLAALSALRRDRLADHVVRGVGIVGLTLPQFWVGLLLVSFVALGTGWFPVGGYGTGVGGHFKAMVLPALTLAIGLAPIQIRALRSALIDVLGSEYVSAGRAVGIADRRLLLRHVIPNALPSVVTILSLQVSLMLFGAVVVEKTFALPGLGQALLEAVSQRDYAVVQGITLISALIVIAANLLADAVYVALDPRIELS
jgi:peptide/nickel transport system permease protein